MTATAPTLEKARGRARIIAQAIFAINLLMVCMSILLLFYYLWIAFRVYGNRPSHSVDTYDADSNPSWFFIPKFDQMNDEQKTGLATATCMLTIMAFCVYVPQFFSATLLLQGTEKNLKLTDAIQLIDTHQGIQLIFLFAEIVVLMVSTYATVFDELIEIVSWRNILFSALLRISCMCVVDLFGNELDAAIDSSEKKKLVEKAGQESSMSC